jgi:hypothetical protein
MDVFIFVVSPDSITSNDCQWEIDIAISYSKQIICMYVDTVDINKIPIALLGRPWIELVPHDYLCNKCHSGHHHHHHHCVMYNVHSCRFRGSSDGKEVDSSDEEHGWLQSVGATLDANFDHQRTHTNVLPDRLPTYLPSLPDP